MHIKPIKTKKFRAPKDDVLPEIFRCIESIEEGSILVITSKVVSIDQGRCVPVNVVDKDELIKKESELFLPRTFVPEEHVLHTITNDTLIASAGIDASNADDHYILWPKDLEETLKEWYKVLKEHYEIENFGILIVDSRSMPMRRGVVGIAIGSMGFHRLNDYRESVDIFNRPIKFSQVNIPDALAAAAVVTMGETNEQTPLALICDVPFVVFGDEMNNKKHSEYVVPKEDDIYKPFLDVPWQKGGKGATTSI